MFAKLKNSRLAEPFILKKFRSLALMTLCFSFAGFLDYMALIALLVYGLKLGANVIAIMTVVYMLPLILFSAFVGKIAERTHIGKIMLVSYISRALIMLIMFFYAHNFIFILIVLALKSAISSFDAPCDMLAIRKVAQEKLLERSTVIIQLILNSSKVLAPALAGLLLLIMAPEKIFLVSFILYFISVIFLLSIYPLLTRSTAKVNKNSESEDTQDITVNIFSYILKNKVLRFLMAVSGIRTVAMIMCDSFFVLLLKSLGHPASILGGAIACVGLGSIVSNLRIAQSAKEMRHIPMIIKAIIAQAFILIFIGILDSNFIMHNAPILASTYVIFIAMFILGLATGVIFSVQSAYIAKHVPNEVLGRVSSVNSAIMYTSLLVAPLLGAVLIALIGLSFTFMASGAIMLILAISAIYFNVKQYQ